MTRPLRQAATLLPVLSLVLAVLVAAPVRDGARQPGRAARAATAAVPTGTEGHDHGCQLLPLEAPGAPPSCAHEDKAPAGVDVTRKVPTAELRARGGARKAAIRAAQDAGVATAGTAASTSASVTCDGNGTDGYRVQAIYAYGSSGAGRYASVKASIQTWAAGVDTVIDRSAAVTGGARHVRWVTEPDGLGGCRPAVIQVQLPQTALDESGLSQVPAALKTLGYNDNHRKYLVWADAAKVCGIAQLYGDGTYSSISTPDQTNANNGTYPMYARVDTGCWGNAASVEAHELTHMLGAVLSTAPHPSDSGHCYDESDRMCYQDGPTPMRQVCPAEDEYLLDCNNDDYFSTAPRPLSWLATHWNTANSRFLIGGGGLASGTFVDVAANTAPAGLPSQLSATVTVPVGRTYTLAWGTSTAGCIFDDKIGTQAALQCPPSVATATATATVTDSTGVIAQRIKTVLYDQTPRLATVAVTSSSGTTMSTCLPDAVPVQARVVDTATGLGVYGAKVDVRAGVSTMTTVTTGVDGFAAASPSLTAATILNGRVSTTQPTWAGATDGSDVAVTDTCGTGAPPPLPPPAAVTPVISSATASLYGIGTARVAGSVLNGGVPVSNAAITLLRSDYTGVHVIGSGRTDATGHFLLAGPVRYTNRLTVRVAPTLDTLAGTSAARLLPVKLVTLGGISASSTYLDRYLTLTVATNPTRVGKIVYLQRYLGGRWTTIGSLRTGSTGKAHLLMRQRVRGTIYYRWYATRDALNALGIGNTVRVYVR